MDLRELVSREHTAVVLMEMQRGVVGDLAGPLLAPLVDAARGRGIVAALGEVVRAAREVDVPVVHAVVRFRGDGVGTPINTPTLTRLQRSDPDRLREGAADTDVLPELMPRPDDVLSWRRHGTSAFTGTDLDTALRSLGVRTVLLGGVSLNVGVIGTAIEAVNLGYRVAVVRDGVVGVPLEYGDDVLRHSLRALGAQPTAADIVEAWAD
ncbi:cysteine hydrolase family protein [Microbacterium resistens]|uniref:cysteine hydrolase family protein n=1 Tax=Microbacterium resistens TaxID=156977 RepID=UPI00366E4732